MPFRQKSLSAARPKLSVYEALFKRYPEHPNTLGERLRKYRIDHGLRQIKVAQDLGVSLTAIQGWELGRFAIGDRFQQRIRQFIGQPSNWQPRTLADHLRTRRFALGLTQRQVAKVFGIHSSKLQYWESGGGMKESRLPRLIDFLGYDPRKHEQGLKKVRLANGMHSYS